MATIEPYETSSGRRYMVRYRTPERHQTKRRGFRTKRDAEEFASSVEVQKMRGEYVSYRTSQITIGELAPAWLERQSGHLKPSTRRSLEIAWRVHVLPRWEGVRVAEVTHSAVQSWVTSMGRQRGATTVKRAFGVLSAVLDEAVRDRRLISNRCAGVKTPRKVAKEREYLSHQQVATLARESGAHGPLVRVLAYTGLRWGEVTALRVRDVDQLRRRLVVARNAVEVGSEIVIGTPKSHEARSVPYPAFLEAEIRLHCASKLPDALLFPGRDGGFSAAHEQTRPPVDGSRAP